MPVIRLRTTIAAPPERVFDLCRSIDAHLLAAKSTGERAVGGVTSGLLGPDEEVTWEARHLGVRQRLTVQMTAFARPERFQDTMIRGAFRRMTHDHEFIAEGEGTVMIDRFEFESPLGLLGRIFDRLILFRYLQRFLVQRNEALKQLAESNEWQRYLDPSPPR